MDDCIFCRIIKGSSSANIIGESLHTIAFTPLNPVIEGHILIVPKIHITDFQESSTIFADAAKQASLLARELGYQHCNIITSKGIHATQSVFHLHIHIVPRHEGDLLHLPWTGQDHDDNYTRLREATNDN